MAARSCVHTIVAPDIDASVGFYRDVMGNDLVGRGVLGAQAPAVDGHALAGRAWALLGPTPSTARAPSGARAAAGMRTPPARAEGFIRLLQAPAGAAANRPRPGASITDGGLAAIECRTSAWQSAFQRLAASNAHLVAPPVHTFAGAADAPTSRSMIFSAFGPAGEQLFIRHRLDLTADFRDLFGPFSRSFLLCRDRAPVLAFYARAFGLESRHDVHVGEDVLNYRAVNTALGAPQGTSFRFGEIGSEPVIEWREYVNLRPPAKPPYPTSLERTGLAMTTLVVDDSAAARRRVEIAGVAVCGSGALPAPMAVDPGFFVRGAEGELIEVVGRR
jgi:catechol 2,3-dioxygenase-like lactoylglutathione lyase family enzyme